MQNVEATRQRIRHTPDSSCNHAYMKGYRFGEQWAELDASVIELKEVGNEINAFREQKHEVPSEEPKSKALELSQTIAGQVFKRFCLEFGGNLVGQDALDLEQGFFDAVSSIYSEVEDSIDDRMYEYRVLEGRCYLFIY